MEYLKLIALKIDDFCSSIFYEDNYSLADIMDAEKDKRDLEANGCTCILMEVGSNLKL